jgi:hypothetical protein
LSFAGGGDGPSLKEALDAAHGHEHNDDGSEMSEADKAKKAANTEGHDHGAGGHSALNKPILIWACISTVLSLILIQANLRGKKTSPTLNS